MSPITLETIRLRCVECGDCWLWDDAVDGGGTPMMRGPGRAMLIVRRKVLELMGVDVTGKLAVSSCADRLCVSPDHAEAWTRKRLQQRTARLTQVHRNVAHMANLSRARRKTAKLTAELAEAIRDDTGTQRERAEKYGVSKSTISAIDRRLIWREYCDTNPFAALMDGRRTA